MKSISRVLKRRVSQECMVASGFVIGETILRWNRVQKFMSFIISSILEALQDQNTSQPTHCKVWRPIQDNGVLEINFYKYGR